MIAAALLLGGCGAEPEDTSAAALRLRFPDHADTVLSAREAFAPAADGFRLEATATGGAWVQAARPEVVLPHDGSGAVRFRRAGGGEIRVRELGAAGEGRMAERAVSYRRAGGTSYWTATEGGVEEWLLLEEGGEAAAAWQVEGAVLRERGAAVELVDEESGAPVMRVTAPRAHAASGRPVALALRARGSRIELSIDMGDAGGEAVLADPVWESTSRMNVPRSGHTATLLPSGKVLLTGGMVFNDDVQASAEVYDPVRDTWTPAASMSVPRHLHTATLLPSGKVLIVGGCRDDVLAGECVTDDPQSIHASAELYDPTVDAWTAAAPMGGARFRHTATWLPTSGEVLVVGGVLEDSGVTGAELYDPVMDSWTHTDSMFNSLRYAHTATWLPTTSQVLVAGGGDRYAAGAGFGDVYRDPELYDPATGSWTFTEFMSAARCNHTATWLPSSGQVLVTGGGNAGNATGSAELYDPAAGTWTDAASMSARRTLHTATLLPDDKVLVSGGKGPSTASNSAELYDPEANAWTVTATMRVGHAAHTATLLLNDQVLVAGASKLAERYHASLGAACTSDDDCEHSVCVDGVCCSSRCTEPCHTCVRSEHLGYCVPQPNGSDLRDECARDGCDGACDGFGSCVAIPEGAACIPGECTDETHSLEPIRCPADGATCPASAGQTREPVDCAPYRCNAVDGTCRTECGSLQDCAPGFACAFSGQCTAPAPAASRGCGVTPAAAELTFDQGLLGALLLALLAMGKRRSWVCRAKPAREP
ncbi:Kelch repeat-containing protein [Sorangium sp. So ce1153]|uniref:Kelch repeat-containing protein n=1 Tax=Sorangium sp. So ce1153 TaxID=3133333 RepID=UPI003F63BEFE